MKPILPALALTALTVLVGVKAEARPESNCYETKTSKIMNGRRYQVPVFGCRNQEPDTDEVKPWFGQQTNRDPNPPVNSRRSITPTLGVQVSF